MILDRSHPLLRGCKLFWVADSLGGQNLVGFGPSGTVASGIALAGGRGRRAAAFDNTGDNHVTFANQNNYLHPATGLTVIFRSRVDGASGGVDTPTSGLVGCRNGALATTTSGWGFYHIRDTYSNPGVNFAVYGAANAFNYVTDSSAAAYSDSEGVYCGTFDQTTGLQQLYADGILVDSDTVSTSTYVVDTTADITVGGFPDVDVRLDGQVEFLAVFNRVLSQTEIKAWSRDSLWPFLRTPSVSYSNGPTVTYISDVSAYGPFSVGGVSGVGTYGNSVRVKNSIGGTINAEDTETGASGVSIGRYTTGMGVVGPANGGTPVLTIFNTLVGASSTAAISTIAAFETEVGVRELLRTRADNRPELIGLGRYRR